jgi:hypothetical protein
LKPNKSPILLAMLLLGMLLVGYGLLTEDQAVIKNGMRRDATGQMLDQLGYADKEAASTLTQTAIAVTAGLHDSAHGLCPATRTCL